MKRLLLLLLLLPFGLSAQEETRKDTVSYRNAINLNTIPPWFAMQNISLAYQRYLDNITAVEVEVFYTLNWQVDPTDGSFSEVEAKLRSGTITGGLNILSKHHLNKSSYFYASVGVGYFRYAFDKSHTVCTEVGEAVNGLCPCLNFVVNSYERDVNQFSGEIRLGIAPPFLKADSHIHFDVYFGFGGRRMYVSEPNYMSHVLCSNNFSNRSNTQEVFSRKNNRRTKFTAAGNQSYLTYPVLGLKLGYAF